MATSQAGQDHRQVARDLLQASFTRSTSSPSVSSPRGGLGVLVAGRVVDGHQWADLDQAEPLGQLLVDSFHRRIESRVAPL